MKKKRIQNTRKVSKLSKLSYKSIKEMQQILIDNPKSFGKSTWEIRGIKSRNLKDYLIASIGKKVDATSSYKLPSEFTSDVNQKDYTSEITQKVRNAHKEWKYSEKERFFALCKKISFQKYGEDIFEITKNSNKLKVLYKNKIKIVHRIAKKSQFKLIGFEKLHESEKRTEVYNSLMTVTKSKQEAKRLHNTITSTAERFVTNSKSTMRRAA